MPGDDLESNYDCSTLVPDSECDSATLVPENVNGKYVGIVSSLIVQRIDFIDELLMLTFHCLTKHCQSEVGLWHTTQPFFLVLCQTFEVRWSFACDPYAEPTELCNHISWYYNVFFSVDVADLGDFDDEHTDKEEDLSAIVPVDHIISWDDLDRDGKLY